MAHNGAENDVVGDVGPFSAAHVPDGCTIITTTSPKAVSTVRLGWILVSPGKMSPRPQESIAFPRSRPRQYPGGEPTVGAAKARCGLWAPGEGDGMKPPQRRRHHSRMAPSLHRMDTPPATVINSLVAEVEIPKDGTLSRVLYKDDNVRLVLFAFDTDQELTEHTASMPAIVQIISGRAELVLGEEKTVAVPGTWVHMPAHLQHAVLALEPTILLLTLIRQ